MTERSRPAGRHPERKATERSQIEAAVLKLKALRQNATLGALDWRRLRDEGRK